MSEDTKNGPNSFSSDSLAEAIRALGGIGSNQNLSNLRDCFSQMNAVLKPSAPEQPKDPRKRLCPVVQCYKCHATNVTLYIYGDRRICKKCKKELNL